MNQGESEDATFFEVQLVAGTGMVFILGMAKRLMLTPHVFCCQIEESPDYVAFSWLFVFLGFPRWKWGKS